MKKNTLIGLLLVATTSFVAPTYAALTVVNGKPVVIFTDPSDVVVQLDKAGTCGSVFFNIQRSNRNYEEFSSLVQQAFLYGKSLQLYVSSCSGDRNILSHGGMY